MKTGKRVRQSMFSISMAFLLCAGTAGAQGGVSWPVTTDLVAKRTVGPLDVGDVRIWNTREDLTIEITAGTDAKGKPYALTAVNIWTANEEDFSSIVDGKNRPDPSVAPYKAIYPAGTGVHVQHIPLPGFGLRWGKPLLRYVVIHAEVKGLDEAAYALGDGVFLDAKGRIQAYYLTYPFARVSTGHFVDAKVRGLTFRTPTQSGTSGDSGNFFYIPPELVGFWVGSLYLGTAVGDHTVSPIDLFPGSDLDDDRVLNVARVLQTLDSNAQAMLIDVTENIHCVDSAMASLDVVGVNYAVDLEVESLLSAMSLACPTLQVVSKELARANLEQGQQAANILKTNVSKNPGMPADKAKIEILPVYVPAQTADGMSTTVVYHDADGNTIETRHVAKPLVVVYEEEVEGTGARDVFVAISRDDGSTWKRRNISKTAGRSSFTTAAGRVYPGESNKPMLSVKDNLIFLAWTDKYCRGGRPGYSITTSAQLNCDSNGDAVLDGVLRVTHEGTECVPDYPGDDAYWRDDIYGVAGPQRSVLYDPLEWPEMGEVPYSCVWTARGKVEASGDIVWFKPERVTSGRRDAIQLVSAAAEDAGIAIAWQEDPKGLRPPGDYGPGDGWSGATVSNKTDIWYSFISFTDFEKVDYAYTPRSDGDIVDADPELAGRLKALVPMSLPVRISDNDVCSLESMAALGGGGDGEDHETTLEEPHEPTGDGTHRYCGSVTVQEDGTLVLTEPTPLCAYTIPFTNHNGETHHVCVTVDPDPTDTYDARRVFRGNTGASRPNLFLQPYQKPDGSKGAWAILAYEESKGLGTPPEVEGEEDEDRYKPDLGKNIIYHSFEFTQPETVSGGGILNEPETDASGSPVFVKDEYGNLILDLLGRPQLAYENARRVRLLQQPKGKAGPSQTVLVALYRQGEEGHGKPADIFMRRMTAPKSLPWYDNPYAFSRFVAGAQNLSSVEPGEIREYDVTDPDTGQPDKITKMVNWTWGTPNLSDKSGKEPYSDAKAHRGALDGDELVIAYTWTPNWGRKANDKYDLYVRRSWGGGRNWRTDPNGQGPIDHTIVFVDPVTKEQTVTITSYEPGALEPPRNISNLRNNRISLLEPRLVKTPGDIKSSYFFPEDTRKPGIYQIAWGLEANELNNPDIPFRAPLDIYYGRTTDKGQNYETVIITKGDGNGGPEEGWNLLAKDRPGQFGAQLKQTPDGSRMYAVWVERTEEGGDIMFRRVDYRPAPSQ